MDVIKEAILIWFLFFKEIVQKHIDVKILSHCFWLQGKQLSFFIIHLKGHYVISEKLYKFRIVIFII